MRGERREYRSPAATRCSTYLHIRMERGSVLVCSTNSNEARSSFFSTTEEMDSGRKKVEMKRAKPYNATESHLGINDAIQPNRGM